MGYFCVTLGMARANQLLTFVCQASYHPTNHRETADAEDFIPRLDSSIRESWDEPDRQEEAGRASNHCSFIPSVPGQPWRFACRFRR
jgi:hypothetical protein